MTCVVSWNVNSIRARLTHLEKLCDKLSPDVICLQETKVRDCDFPLTFVHDLGFKYVKYYGIPNYNGVAIISRLPMSVSTQTSIDRQDGRHLSVYLLNQDIRIDNLYVPAGGTIPDPVLNTKFNYKLYFLESLAEMASRLTGKVILIGDINIAPGKFDVWSHQQMLKRISHTPLEINAFNRLLELGHLTNVLRYRHSEPKVLYSWWSYRIQQWKPQSRGLLLDHALVTQDMMTLQPQAYIFTEVRGWLDKPSDHAPLILEW